MKQNLVSIVFYGFFEKVTVKDCKNLEDGWEKLKAAFEVSEITIWKTETICQ